MQRRKGKRFSGREAPLDGLIARAERPRKEKKPKVDVLASIKQKKPDHPIFSKKLIKQMKKECEDQGLTFVMPYVRSNPNRPELWKPIEAKDRPKYKKKKYTAEEVDTFYNKVRDAEDWQLPNKQ